MLSAWLLSILDAVRKYDIALLRAIHAGRIEVLDTFLYGFSFVTTYVSILAMLTLAGLSWKKQSTMPKLAAAQVFLTWLLAVSASLAIKTFSVRARPFNTFPDIQKLSEAGSSSFPSGHTTDAWAIALAASLLLPQWWIRIPLLLWASLVAYSRIALGVHYPTDVAGGIAIAAVSCITVAFFFKRRAWNRKAA